MNNRDLKLGLVNYALQHDAKLVPLLINSEISCGTGLMNPSVLVDDNRILVNLRHVNYTLYHSEGKIFHHQYGPLQYLHPEDDVTLRTVNFLMELDNDLNLINVQKINTDEFDVKPDWHFTGKEDARLIKWNDKFYICGVRRDDNTTGIGRMEISEISIEKNSVKEVSRFKIPAPGKNNSYCEKNWMPVLDKSFTWVKWCNPTEVAEFDLNDQSCKTIVLDESKIYRFPRDLRGGSQVLKYKTGYITLTHEVHLFKDLQGRKDGRYRHRFIVWDENWNITHASDDFSFMTGEIEFCAGMAYHKDQVLISFGFQDNAAYILSMPINIIDRMVKPL
jgi:hypothetical protein